MKRQNIKTKTPYLYANSITFLVKKRYAIFLHISKHLLPETLFAI